jgi:3-oxoacid CoA-transferase
VQECNLPLTGKNVVHMIVTELGVFAVDHKEGLMLTEIAPDSTLEEIRAKTGCPFSLAKDL